MINTVESITAFAGGLGLRVLKSLSDTGAQALAKKKAAKIKCGYLIKSKCKWINIRRSNASYYDANLEGVLIPFVSPNSYHVYHQYTLRIVGHNRNDFAKELEKRGVGTGIYYPTPVHKLKSFGSRLNLPETYDACQEVLSIPIHPTLSQTELEHIVLSVNAVAKAGA